MVAHKNFLKKGIEAGILAILLILVINLLVLSFLNFPEMAVSQIKKYWLLLLILIGGFGFQIGLHNYLKYKNAVCSAATMTSGGVSSVSMIICCSHYIIPVLPFLSVTISFLTKYTPYVLLFGIFSSLLGTFFLLKKAEVHIKDKAAWRTRITMIFLIIIAVSSVFAQYSFNENDNVASAAGAAVQSDKCKAPEGYTQEKWAEHMGHHPEQYDGCLN